MNKDYFKALRKKEQFYTTYPTLLESKFFKGHIKLVLLLILNDVEMNTTISWSQGTYAKKLGLTRPVVYEMFRRLQELEVITSHDSNKPGKRKNKYDLNWQTFLQLCKSQAVKKSKQVVKKSQLSCKENVQSCKENWTDTDNTDILQKGNISREKTSFKDVSPKEIEALMHEITKTI